MEATGNLLGGRRKKGVYVVSKAGPGKEKKEPPPSVRLDSAGSFWSDQGDQIFHETEASMRGAVKWILCTSVALL